MRTLFPLAAVLCIGLMAAFMAGSGFNAIIGTEGGAPAAGEVGGEIEDVANNSTANTSVEGSAQGSGDSTIVGMVFSAVGEIMRIVGLILMMPMTLRDLNFPIWFAAPVGSVISIVVSVGILQFVTGRIYR